MARHRLLNCEFVEDSRFKVKLTNKAKLLYFFMFVSADDKGFVGNALELIDTLNKNDDDSGSLELVQNKYEDSIHELVDKGFLYCFKDNHNNNIYLIRHWFCHNKYYDKAWTNYGKYLKKVKLSNGEYTLKGKEEIEQPQPQEELNTKEEEKSDDWDKIIKDLESDEPQENDEEYP